MHVPDSQAHPSGNWFAVHESGQALIRPHQSFLNCENFWALKRERRLARQDTGELQWSLEDFQRNAKRHGVIYVGKPAKAGLLHASIPDLEEWVTKYDVRLPAILTHAWDERHVPDNDPLQRLLWWKSVTSIPFQARFGDLRDCLETNSTKCRFALDAFKDIAKILKLNYLGPLVKHVQVIDGQQTKRSAWQPDENAIPEQPSSWPPWKRPAYWCLIEKHRKQVTRERIIFFEAYPTCWSRELPLATLRSVTMRSWANPWGTLT